MKILVVDDEVCVARAIQRGVREHVIVVATNAATALQHVAAAALTMPFDLVLCDARMPGMTGLELLAALRRYPEPPMFVLMSGDDAVFGTASGADEVMLKPFALAELRRAIARIRQARAEATTARISRSANTDDAEPAVIAAAAR